MIPELKVGQRILINHGGYEIKELEVLEVSSENFCKVRNLIRDYIYWINPDEWDMQPVLGGLRILEVLPPVVHKEEPKP